MNEFSEVLVRELVQRSVALSITAGIVFALLRIVKPASSKAHRFAWCLVLLQGWMIFQLAIPVGWMKVTDKIELARNESDVAKKVSPPNKIVPRVPQPVNEAENSILKNDLEMPVLVQQPVNEKAVSTETAKVPISIPSQDIHEVSTPMNWQSWVIAFWLTGIVAIVLRWTYSYVRFVRSLTKFRKTNIREGEAPAEPLLSQHAQWKNEWKKLLKERSIPQKIAFSIHENHGPMLCRLPRCYQIVVPQKLWETLSAIERRSILEHELAHFQRGDIWKSLAMRILSLPHWFNPCSWLAVRAFDEAAEWACDDIVRKRNPDAHVSFAKTLLQLVEFDTPSNALRPGAFGSSIGFRVKRLLSPKILKDTKMKKSLIGILTLGVLILCLVRPQLTAGNSEEDSSVAEPEEKFAQKKEEEKKTKPKIPLATLRYDEKNFEEWKHIYLTELSYKKRTEAIKALGKFGENGYPREAAEAIAEIAFYYDFSKLLNKKRHSSLSPENSPILGLVAIRAFKAIDDPVLIDILKSLISSKEKSRIWFAMEVLNNRMSYSQIDAYFLKNNDFPQADVEELIPALIEVVNSLKKSRLPSAAISMLYEIDPKRKGFQEQLQKWMKDKNDITAITACSVLSDIAPKASGLSNKLGQLLTKFHSNRFRRTQIIRLLIDLGKNAKGAIPDLFELIRIDAKNYQVKLDSNHPINPPTLGAIGGGFGGRSFIFYDVGNLFTAINTDEMLNLLLETYNESNSYQKYFILEVLRLLPDRSALTIPFLKNKLEESENLKGKKIPHWLIGQLQSVLSGLVK